KAQLDRVAALEQAPDQQGAQSALLWRRDLRPAMLAPAKLQPRPLTNDFPIDRDIAFGGRESAMLGRIGRQFVDHQGEGHRRAGADAERGALDAQLRRFRLDDARHRVDDHRLEVRFHPFTLDQHVVRRAQRHDAGIEAGARLFDGHAFAEDAHGEGLHDRQRVLHAVGKLARQHFLALAGKPAFGAVAHDLEKALDFSVLDQRRHFAGAPETAAVLPQMPAFIGGMAVARRLFHFDLRRFHRAVFGREITVGRLSQRLFLAPAQNPVCPFVPGGDPPVQIRADDGVIGGAIEQRLEKLLTRAAGRKFRHSNTGKSADSGKAIRLAAALAKGDGREKLRAGWQPRWMTMSCRWMRTMAGTCPWNIHPARCSNRWASRSRPTWLRWWRCRGWWPQPRWACRVWGWIAQSKRSSATGPWRPATR